MAQDMIIMANVELKREWLLAKEKKLELSERLTNGEKKYEDLWLESKARYESLPFVQKLLKSKAEVQNIKQQINELENEEKSIYEQMKAKMETCRDIERKRIIQLAEYMVVEMPKKIKMIKEKSAAIKAITEEIKNLEPKTNDKTSKSGDDDDLKPDNDCTSFMPKLQLNYFDFDNLNANLDKIKGDEFTKTPEKTYSVHSIIVIDPNKITKRKSPNTEEYISSFFYKPIAKYEANKKQNYAKKKLINILDDIKIDRNGAQKMIEVVNPDVLQPVDSISVEEHQRVEKNYGILNTKGKDNMESEDIEEIDMSASGEEQMIRPPTQFLDMTPVDATQKIQKERPEELVQALTSKEKNSQEESSKKTVKFDLPNNMEVMTVDDAEKAEDEGDIDANVTINSQLDTSANDADVGFAKIKDMIMKKHNLDLSPQFVYTKNVMTPLNIRKADDTVVTSKFFPQEQNQKNDEVQPKVDTAGIEEDQVITAKEIPAVPMEIDNPAKLTVQTKPPDDVTSPKEQKVSELTEAETPMTGFMFGPSTQLTSDFLEESANTTFEDGDYAACLDSSLLLSPKAGLSLTNNETQESLEVPNFLSGVRKTGFSFFGQFSSESKPDSSGQNLSQGTSGFNFNFAGEEKKSRGGLFSMFK